MKTILFTVAIVLAPFVSNAQKVSFVVENDTITTDIKGYGEDRFITDLGYLRYDDVWVILHHDDNPTEELVSITGENNIVLHPLNEADTPLEEGIIPRVFKNKASDISRTSSVPNPVRVERVPDYSIDGEKIYALQNQISDLELRIENFRVTRNTGFGLQAAGIGLSIASVNSQSPEMAILGTALMIAGYIVNATAGKALKRRRNR